jgi:putative ABC transport system permease protein
MSSYPITIDAQAFDLSSIISDSSKEKKESETPEHALDGVYSDSSQLEMQSAVTSSISKNNLTQFKKYLDDPESKIHDYVGQNGISYTYDTSFCIYAYDTDGVLINTDGSSFEDASSGSYAMSASMSAMMGEGTGSNSNFAQILSGDGSIVSDAIKDSYDVVYGTWPENYDEVVLVLNSNNEISMTALYDLGMLPSARYNNLIEQIYDGKKVSLETESFSYEDVCKQSFYLIPACNMYEKNDDGTYSLIADDTAYNGRELKMGQQNNSEKLDESSVSGTGSDNKNMEALLDSGIKLKITGVIRANNDDDSKHLISGNVGYTKLLTDYIIDYTDKSDVVSAQKADKTVNILNGMTFAPKGDAKKIEDVKKYISGMSTADKAALCKTMMQYMSADAGTGISMGMDAAGAGTETEAGTSVQVQNAQEQNAQEQMTDDQYAEYLDMYLEKADDAVLLKMYDSLISSGSYDDNMTAFGVVDKDVPSSISIYADSFEDKDGISDCIEEYNATASDGDKITYTDYVGLLMSSVTTIVNVISYVLIAFVAVSLIVSSIMIGIITYISVLERTKEIGILRAIGASKHNVSQVFNAETFIIGFQAGLIGIGVTLLLLIPGNLIIHRLTGTVNVNAALPVHDGIILIVLSIILTLIGGFIPSKKAAKRDPVTALRSE